MLSGSGRFKVNCAYNNKVMGTNGQNKKRESGFFGEDDDETVEFEVKKTLL